MKGYLTPIPEVATALVEVMESNANKLFDVNLSSPLQHQSHVFVSLEEGEDIPTPWK
jgi:hypothetical protein